MASNIEAPNSGRQRILTEKGRAFQFEIALKVFQRLYAQLMKLFEEVEAHLKQEVIKKDYLNSSHRFIRINLPKITDKCALLNDLKSDEDLHNVDKVNLGMKNINEKASYVIPRLISATASSDIRSPPTNSATSETASSSSHDGTYRGIIGPKINDSVSQVSRTSQVSSTKARIAGIRQKIEEDQRLLEIKQRVEKEEADIKRQEAEIKRQEAELKQRLEDEQTALKQRLERAKADLKREQDEAEIRIEEAKLKAMEEEDNEQLLTLDEVGEQSDRADAISSFSDDRHSRYESPLPNARNTFKYPTFHNIPQAVSPVNQSYMNPNHDFTPNRPQSQIFESSANQGLINLTNALNSNRLPIPEPPVFSGDPLQYPNWVCAFEALIENRGIPTIERIHYLNKYLSGKAKAAVGGYFSLRSENAYQKARDVLEKRFGNQFIIADEFQKKLELWPKIQAKDSKGLREFSDFLNQCQIAALEIPNLTFLNDMREIGRISSKLPEWISHRWRRSCAKIKEGKGRYPTFKEFAEFVMEESELANDPVINRDRDSKKGNVSTGSSSRTSANVLVASTEPPSTKTKNCVFCTSKEHFISQCPKFLKETLDDRIKFLKEKRRCFKCLNLSHTAKECKKPHTCKTCKKLHPTCLHDPNKGKNDSEAVSLKIKANSYPMIASASTSIMPVWLSSKKDPTNEKLVYAILDSGSDSTFLEESIATDLNLPNSNPTRLKIETIKDDQRSDVVSYIQSDLQVRGYYNDKYVSLPPSYTVPNIPMKQDSIPNRKLASNWQHLKGISDKIPPWLNCDFVLLIGYDCSQAFIPREVIEGKDEEPFGLKTDLGWTVIGPSAQNPNPSKFRLTSVCNRIATKEVPLLKPNDACRILEKDFPEDKDGEKKTSLDDMKFLEILESSIKKNKDGYLEMPLPFRKAPNLPNNKDLAVKRLSYLKRKLQNNTKLLDDYRQFMKSIIDRGDVEETVAGEEQEWYLPHHGVYHPKKRKLRVVFDCSAKYGGTSLNDHLLIGPNMINNLNGVFCRFRRHEVAFTCDIEKMFHQFKMDVADRKFLKFLWWEEGNLESEPKVYRMKVHLFGAASSPGCANFGLKYLAKLNENKFPSASHFIKSDFYVDDGLSSASTEEEAIKLIKDATQICKEGGLRLHKFTSNSVNVMNSIPESERSENVKTLNLSFENSATEKALGMTWAIDSDSIRFSISEIDSKPTRRGLLSLVASLYDPMGLIAPFTLTGKRILQEACKTGSKWDEPISKDILPQWENWKGQLKFLNEISIPRCYHPPNFGKIANVQLHHFSDASFQGYGMCTYLRLTNDKGQVHCSLVTAKARVTPSKPVSVPRLELTAALVAAQIGSSIKEQLQMDINQEFFWTDSQVVLGYINNDAKRFHIFVANRVQKIRELTEPSQWRHVITSQNPADHASRGLSIQQLKNSNWFTGPEWLWKEDIILPPSPSYNIEPNDPEVRITLKTQCVANTFNLNDRLSRVSKWMTAVKVVARIMRLCNNVKKEVCLSPDEIRKASDVIVQNVQKHFLAEEYKRISDGKSLPSNSHLFHVEPFMKDGILRTGGRIKDNITSFEETHPIILPKCHITDLIITHCHELVKHQGRGLTLNELRCQGYWIIGGSRQVAKQINQCVICRKLRGNVVEQHMSDLPKERTEPSPPFTFVGMDCFGPIIVKNGRKEVKRYGLLFTCLCSRAIHLEMLDDLSTDAFINALRCFIAIRGHVQKFYSDQGTNFVGASNEFKAAMKDKIPKTFTGQCEFVFNTPNASHAGGVWERQIRTVKSILTATTALCPGRLDDASLRTFLYETMAIVNSRPITAMHQGDPTSPQPLTPNQILTMKSKIPLPPPGAFVKEDLYLRKRWRRVQYLLEQFWSRWRREYVTSISKRQKWLNPKRNIQEDDIVLIVDDNLPRNQWKLGKVVDAPKSKDGLVRHAKIRVGSGDLDAKGRPLHQISILDRPVQKLIHIL